METNRIKENLVATGFGEEIDYFGWDRIRKHPLISNTQPITDLGGSIFLYLVNALG